MQWLERNHALISPLFGDIFLLDSWEDAFKKASSCEQKKVFIKI